MDHGGEFDENGDAALHLEDVSEGTRNGGDFDDARSPVELHHESDPKYVESDDKTLIVEPDGSETREHSCNPSESKELHRNNENNDGLMTETGAVDEEGDIQDVCEKDKKQGFSQLHLATERGDTEAVRSLLMSSPYVDVLDMKHNTPLHIATRNGHVDVINLLLSKNSNVDYRNAFGQTSLHLAAEIGHLAIAQLLLDSNADGQVTGKTPLHIAAVMGSAEMVKAMIDHEGEVNAVDRYGNTALHYAAWNGHSHVVNVLLNQTTEMDEQIRTKLAVNQVPADEFELSQHPIKSKSDVGHISYLITAEGDNAEKANILSSDSSDVNAVYKGQATPHHLAVEQEHAEIGNNVMLNGGNVNACNNDKMTPLHLACQNGHTSIVEILLDNNAMADFMRQSVETPLYLAAKNGHADISDLLIRRGVCDFVEIPSEYETPLKVAVEEGHKKVVEVILKHSCRISEKLTKDGGNLQENTKRGVIPVELLKDDGRRVSAEIVWTEINMPMQIKRNSEGDDPLLLTALSIDWKMVQLLLSVDQGMYSNTDIADIFRCVIKRLVHYDFTHEAQSDDIEDRMNLEKLAQFLINSSRFNVNDQDQQLNTFLHDMMRQNCVHSSYGCLTKESIWLSLQIKSVNDVIELLLEKGADFNMKNSHGETPLIIASEMGCCLSIQTLFNWEHKSGINLDLDARDRYGVTALIKAAKMHHVSVMRLLLNHKASVNLHDHYGFTALHTAIYEPNRNWFDLHFFCKGFRKRNSNEEYPQIDQRDNLTWKREPVDRNKAINGLKETIQHHEKATRIKEKMAELLLASDETDVNAIDFEGNTPLDLAVKSSKRITSATFEALKNRGAIRNSLDAEDEASIEVAMVDDRGRNPLHRLMIALISQPSITDVKEIGYFLYLKRVDVDLMVYGILLRHENFRHLATEVDDKGRTPLHYAIMQPSSLHAQSLDPVRVLLKLGPDLNAADTYGKTPLHYAEVDDQYKLLVQYGADEDTKDKRGHTPRQLKQLRESVTINENNANDLPIGQKQLNASINIDQVGLHNVNCVTELTKRKFIETIRIYSQSPRPQKSTEEAIWKIWTENEFIRLNRRLSQLNPLIQHFIQRLADGIKVKDWRFECQPILVGSADEEAKVVISADFDFNFKLIKFSQFCDPFPHPLGPKGYFQLKRKLNDNTKSRSDEKFDSFFNSDQCLLTNDVNSRFKIILEEVLLDHNFWQDEHLFEWNEIDKDIIKSEKLAGLCKTVRLRMLHPIEDGYIEDGFLFGNISLDIVACVHVEGWWPEDLLPIGISPVLNTNGCTMVFDRPRFDPAKPYGADFHFSETFARISFAPLESRIIKESSSLTKAAYLVCKIILHDQPKTTYQLKTCLLFCMEALNPRNDSEAKKEDAFTPKQLLFWVERIMFCFVEFSRHDVFPCYFKPSFKQKVAKIDDNDIFVLINEVEDTFLSHSMVYDIYLDLCPDNTVIDIPIDPCEIPRETFNANHDPKWEQFDSEEFIRKLSSQSRF